MYVACFYFACDGIRERNLSAEITSPLTYERSERGEIWEMGSWFLTLYFRSEGQWIVYNHGAFKLDHMQPVELILYHFFTQSPLITQSLLPQKSEGRREQRQNIWKRTSFKEDKPKGPLVVMWQSNIQAADVGIWPCYFWSTLCPLAESIGRQGVKPSVNGHVRRHSPFRVLRCEGGGGREIIIKDMD